MHVHDMSYFDVTQSSVNHKKLFINSHYLLFKAYDIDEEGTKNSEIKYDLNSNYFRINSENGSIYTNMALDRETQERYELSVVAMDKATAARSSNMLVTVIVQDVNDNGPVFGKTEYTVELQEEHIVRDFITLQVRKKLRLCDPIIYFSPTHFWAQMISFCFKRK